MIYVYGGFHSYKKKERKTNNNQKKLNLAGPTIVVKLIQDTKKTSNLEKRIPLP